jgi:hypothetical protein
MKKKNQEIINIENKKVYFNNNKKGWSIVIMPDNILIDNFHHGYPHIHPDRKEIKIDEPNELLKEVLKHIAINHGVNYNKLRMELIK